MLRMGLFVGARAGSIRAFSMVGFSDRPGFQGEKERGGSAGRPFPRLCGGAVQPTGLSASRQDTADSQSFGGAVRAANFRATRSIQFQ